MTYKRESNKKKTTVDGGKEGGDGSPSNGNRLSKVFERSTCSRTIKRYPFQVGNRCWVDIAMYKD